MAYLFTPQAGGYNYNMADILFEQRIGRVSCTYDFAVDGGAVGAIAITGSPTIPNGAVARVEYFVVHTDFASGTGAAEIYLGVATDGNFNEVQSPGDLATGVYLNFSGGSYGLLMTAARTLQLTVGVEALTQGKATFLISYFIP